VSDENPPKSRGGRPKLPAGTGKEFMLRVRMPISMKEALEVAAKRQYLTASELIRKLLQKYLDEC
jgi:predicted DNA-binding protein